jgi:hypothetical protein
MNSSINPSSDSSNSDPFNQVQTDVQITKDHTTSASEGTFSHRQQPIPPPSEPMQYRAIGLVRGSYKAKRRTIDSRNPRSNRWNRSQRRFTRQNY